MAVGLSLDESVEESEGAGIAQSIFRDVDPSDWGYDFLEVHRLS